MIAQVEGERRIAASIFMQNAEDQMAMTMQMVDGYLGGAVTVLGPSGVKGGQEDNGWRRTSLIEGGPIQVGDLGLSVVKETPRMMDGGLAKRRGGSGKKRRRYDSGLGFLEEVDEVDVNPDL